MFQIFVNSFMNFVKYINNQETFREQRITITRVYPSKILKQTLTLVNIFTLKISISHPTHAWMLRTVNTRLNCTLQLAYNANVDKAEVLSTHLKQTSPKKIQSTEASKKK